MADEVTPEKQQARMKEFIGLLPLTLELSGLPKCDPDRLFTPDQMEARATTVRAAFKLARSIVKEIAEGKG